jgi:hypothetical protein
MCADAVDAHLGDGQRQRSTPVNDSTINTMKISAAGDHPM